MTRLRLLPITLFALALSCFMEGIAHSQAAAFMPPVPHGDPFDATWSTDQPAIYEEAELSYSLSTLEGIAMVSNPALAEALSRIEVARGRSRQAGLRPNPKVGYLASEIGNDGGAGQHGAFVGQTVVRGGKLELSRAIECREVRRLIEEYYVTRQRILTDVRTNYYSILWIQRRMELLERFRETNQRAVEIASQLFQAGDNTKSDLLLAEIEYEQTSTDLVALAATHWAKWRELARVVGDSQLAPGSLPAEDAPTPELGWDDALALMQQSPRLAAASAEIARNRVALQRAMVEPIPNVNTQFSLQYDFGTDHTIAGVQVGMPIPIRNRNQGGIYAANASVRAAMQKRDRIGLLIEKELAVKYGAYQNANVQLDRIAKLIVPKAEEVVRIALNAYEAGEVGMADVLNAQRSMLRAARRQLDAEQQVQLSYVAIEGFLLSDGLQTQ